MDYNLQIIWQEQNAWDMAHFVLSPGSCKVFFQFYANNGPEKGKRGKCGYFTVPFRFEGQIFDGLQWALYHAYRMPQVAPYWTNSTIIALSQI